MYFQNSIDFFTIALFLGLMAYAAISDVAEYRIPNRINLAIAALYPAHVLASPTAIDWIGALLVAAVVLGVATTLFSLRVMGGGDVKLMTAVSLWAGPSAIIEFSVVMALTGGLLAVFMLSPLRHGLALALEKTGNQQARDAVLDKVLPYGLAIAAGGFVVAGRLLSAPQL